MKAFVLSGVASVFLWGFYPVAVALGGYEAPLWAAAASTIAASVLWMIALAVAPVPMGGVFRRAWENARSIGLTGLLFAAEVGLFYGAVARSPQTAAVLFEVWVLAFVAMSQILGGGLRLGRKDWVYLAFGLVGVTIAVVDVRAMLAGGVSIPDPLAVVFALLSGVFMSGKTYLNAQIAQRLHDTPSIAVASAPHMLSAIIAIPIWIVWGWAGNETFALLEPDLPIVGLVALIYALGVPMFIYAVSIRPNDAAMAIFYSIPLVAVVLLFLFGLTGLTFYFVIGAAVIFVSNAMLSQPATYVSAAGLAAVLTLLATYVAVSVQVDILPVSRWVGLPSTNYAVELLLLFYGLLFAFVLTNVITTNKAVHRKTDTAVRLLMEADMPAHKRRALYRQMLRMARGSATPAVGDKGGITPAHTAFNEVGFEYRSLDLGNTSNAIFRIFSVGVLLMVLGTLCLSDTLIQRLAGLLILSCVLYFVFYSRDSYLRQVTYPQFLGESLATWRARRHREPHLARRAVHRAGMWLFVLALGVCAALNVIVAAAPGVIVD